MSVDTHTENSSEWLRPTQMFAQVKAPAPLQAAHAVKAAPVRFGYRVGSLGFLVGERVLSEYLPKPVIYPIPNVHDAVSGYVNLQGALVPVWNISTLFDLNAQDSAESVLVLGRGDTRVGIVVSGLPIALKKLENASKPKQFSQLLQNYLGEAYFGYQELWFELDCERLLREQAASIGR
jgi:chemotaxis signal transduction protein